MSLCTTTGGNMARHRAKTKTKMKANLYQKVIGIGAVVSLVSLGTVATYASFTDTGTSAITATAGKITLALGETGTSKSAPIALGTTLVPGASIAKTIVVRNTGTIPMKYTTAVTGTPGTLASTMTAVIKNGTTQLYSGKMNAMKTATQTIPAGGSHTLDLTFAWANGTAAVDNLLMGQSANTTLTFTAVN